MKPQTITLRINRLTVNAPMSRGKLEAALIRELSRGLASPALAKHLQTPGIVLQKNFERLHSTHINESTLGPKIAGAITRTLKS